MRLLTVTGEGYAQAEPDTVTLSMDLTGKATDYATAVDLLNTASERLKTSIHNAPLPTLALETSDFAVNTETRYENGQSIDIGYRASHRMSIVLHNDQQLLNQLIELLSHSQSNAEFQIAFTLKDTELLRQQALKNAVLAAQNNAHTLASTALVQLGKVQEIRYGELSAGQSAQSYGGYGESVRLSMAKADIDPQDIVVRESVLMVFELLD